MSLIEIVPEMIEILKINEIAIMLFASGMIKEVIAKMMIMVSSIMGAVLMK